MYAPSICVVVQLHHSTTVAFQSGKVFTLSVHIPHHCKKINTEIKLNKLYSLYIVGQICFR